MIRTVLGVILVLLLFVLHTKQLYFVNLGTLTNAVDNEWCSTSIPTMH